MKARRLKVLVGCEYSGIVRDAFAANGHDAWSCDFLPSERPGRHLQGDVRDVLNDGWDLAIFHPPCTYLAVSGIHWTNRTPGRRDKTAEALELVRALLDAPIPRICLENPIGVISTHIRKGDQIIQPWEYGEPFSKRTMLWLSGLWPLVPTNILTPTEFQTNGKPRWSNQTATGQNKLGPSPTRAHERARTYAGIAIAMADQWGGMA